MKKKKRSLSSDPSSPNLPEFNGENLPGHIAVIMDGNGRWAKKRKLSRINGHNKGADTVREIVRTSREIGIPYLTLYAFSTENWQRPKSEISALMALLRRFLLSERQELCDNGIRLNAIGEIDRIPVDAREVLLDVIDDTRGNDGMLLTLALSYGGRPEIVQMVKQIAADIADGRLKLEDITSDTVADRLYTHGIPDPDLLIRTSGEFRISNFLLWQIAYSEIYVTDTLWPDFTKDEFLHIIKEYTRRDRRFGKV